MTDKAKKTTKKIVKKTATAAAKPTAATAKSVPKKPVFTAERWVLVNGENQVLGRIASRVAQALSGKDQPSFERHKDNGAHVVVINARKLRMSGKKELTKTYKHYSGFNSGLKYTPYEKMMGKRPDYPLVHAVQGMLPKNSLGNHMMKKLRVYADASHPHAAQKPQELKV